GRPPRRGAPYPGPPPRRPPGVAPPGWARTRQRRGRARPRRAATAAFGPSVYLVRSGEKEGRAPPVYASTAGLVPHRRARRFSVPSVQPGSVVSASANAAAGLLRAVVGSPPAKRHVVYRSSLP